MQPAAITRVLMRRRGQRIFNLSTFITMLVSCAIASSVLLIAELAITDGEPAFTMLFPIPAIGGAFEDEFLTIGLQMVSAFIVTAVLAISAFDDLGFVGRREWATRCVLTNREMKERLASEAGEASPEHSPETEPPGDGESGGTDTQT